MDRRGALAGIAVVAVASAGLGWFAGQRIKSPAEIAADAAPPEASLITVAVEERELSSRVIVRGTVTSNEETTITVSGSIEGSSIITRLPKLAGDNLEAGEVAIEVAGRPLFVLPGELPVFRSLGPGVEGPDVRQLEQALLKLGYDPGSVDAKYDSALAGAVAALYRDAGYTPNEPSQQDLSQIEAVRARIREGERSLAESSATVSESTRLQFKQTIIQLTDELNRAVAERDAAVAGPLAERNQAQAEVDATVGDEAAHAAALAHYADVDYAYWIAGLEPNKAVEAAELNLAIARAQQAEASSGGQSLGSVRDSLASDRKELNRLQASIGVTFPATELVFVPSLPRSIQSVLVDVGSTPQGAVMRVTGTSTQLQSSVSASDRKLLSEGMSVMISEDDLGISAEGTISFLAPNPGGGSVADDRYLVRITPVADLPDDAYGQSLKVEIPISSTGGAVLAVPLAGVSAGPGGEARVEIERSDGTVELVEVSTGLSAQGLVQVTSLSAPLEAGDRVVIGRDLVLPGAGNESDEEGS